MATVRNRGLSENTTLQYESSIQRLACLVLSFRVVAPSRPVVLPCSAPVQHFIRTASVPHEKARARIRALLSTPTGHRSGRPDLEGGTCTPPQVTGLPLAGGPPPRFRTPQRSRRRRGAHFPPFFLACGAQKRLLCLYSMVSIEVSMPRATWTSDLPSISSVGRYN